MTMRIPVFCIAAALALAPAAVTAQDSLPEIDYGETFRAQLGAGSARDASGLPYDLYLFAGEAGHRVTVTLDSDEFAPALTLYRASDGREIAMSHGAREATLATDIEADDMYLIGVTSLARVESAPYRLSLAAQGPAPMGYAGMLAAPLGPGGSHIAAALLTSGPAYKAGLRVADRIVAIDGVDVKGATAEEFNARLGGRAAGSRLSLTIQSPGASSTRTVTVRLQRLDEAMPTILPDLGARLVGLNVLGQNKDGTIYAVSRLPEGMLRTIKAALTVTLPAAELERSIPVSCTTRLVADLYKKPGWQSPPAQGQIVVGPGHEAAQVILQWERKHWDWGTYDVSCESNGRRIGSTTFWVRLEPGD